MLDGKVFAVHVRATHEQVREVCPTLFDKFGVPYRPGEEMLVGVVDGRVPVVTKEEIQAAWKRKQEADAKMKQEGESET